MQFKQLALAVALAFALPAVHAGEGQVLTATRVFHTIVKYSPFLVESTTVVTWTQSSSIAETATPTPIPNAVATAAAE
ncbi:hypothetical protein D9611_005995 [Ephemerocybe angulata]|uniref:Uncharacterized protein n=1 Tax=Ephemerocybe angulata TaxID=980116 RepID=A0A8H5CGY4_9AGAR|nr:hypothetical protein D9611_005995 [Tulosesus angulatus]